MRKTLSNLKGPERSHLNSFWKNDPCRPTGLTTFKIQVDLKQRSGPAPGALVPHHFSLEVTLLDGTKREMRIFLRFTRNPLGEIWSEDLVRVVFLGPDYRIIDKKGTKLPIRSPADIADHEYPEFDEETVLREICLAFMLAGFVKMHGKGGEPYRFFTQSERPPLKAVAAPVDYGQMADSVVWDSHLSRKHRPNGKKSGIKRSCATGRFGRG